MKRLKYILQHRYLFKVLAILVIITILILTKCTKKESIYTGNETEFIGTIYKLKNTDNKTTIYIKSKEKIVVNYYEKITNLKLGDTILINGKLEKPKNNTIPNQFNYKNYL